VKFYIKNTIFKRFFAPLLLYDDTVRLKRRFLRIIFRKVLFFCTEVWYNLRRCYCNIMQVNSCSCNLHLIGNSKRGFGGIDRKRRACTRFLRSPPIRVGQGCKTLDFLLFVTFSLKKEKVRGCAPGSAIKIEKTSFFLPNLCSSLLGR